MTTNPSLQDSRNVVADRKVFEARIELYQASIIRGESIESIERRRQETHDQLGVLLDSTYASLQAIIRNME